jgi:restriction system protein
MAATKHTNEITATLWGIHAGKTGDADTLFLKKKYVALGWAKMGDLGSLKDRDAFKDRVAQAYPESKPGAIPNNAGQLFRFVHEMKSGDLVIYASKLDHQVHIGRVTGPYKYDLSLDAGYPHLRPVEWLKEFPRTHFSQGALYEIGSAMSFFQVKTYADEFTAALEGKGAPLPVAQDATVGQVAEDIEETTRDFILKRLAQDLKGHPFAHFVAHLLSAMGYQCRVAPEGPDGGIDILAHEDELGFKPPIIKVQVKSTTGSIGNEVVTALYGHVKPGEYGLLVTLGTFSNQARTFARNQSNLRLVDGEDLVNLIYQHYERFDSRYKGLLPLRRVYVPEAIEGENE